MTSYQVQRISLRKAALAKLIEQLYERAGVRFDAAEPTVFTGCIRDPRATPPLAKSPARRKDATSAIPRVRLRAVGRRHAVGAGASGLAA